MLFLSISQNPTSADRISTAVNSKRSLWTPTSFTTTNQSTKKPGLATVTPKAASARDVMIQEQPIPQFLFLGVSPSPFTSDYCPMPIASWAVRRKDPPSLQATPANNQMQGGVLKITSEIFLKPTLLTPPPCEFWRF